MYNCKCTLHYKIFYFLELPPLAWSYSLPWRRCKLSWCNHSLCVYVCVSVSVCVLGRSLMIGWRKNSWNPERVSSVFTFVSVRLSVCLFLRTQATDHSFWARNLIFGSSDPWDMRKKRIFFVFRNFHFYPFYRHFSIFFL